MFANQSEFQAVPEEEVAEYESQSDDAFELYDADDDELLVSPTDDADDEAGTESSLDELLARRAAKALEEEEEEARLAGLASLFDGGSAEVRVKTVPPQRPEFVCGRCRLVKPQVQLSDSARSLCRDCA